MIAPEINLREIKRRLSPRILQIPGVSGIGIPGGQLTVYLAEGSEDIRRKVAEVIKSETPGVACAFTVSGSFHPQ